MTTTTTRPATASDIVRGMPNLEVRDSVGSAWYPAEVLSAGKKEAKIVNAAYPCAGNTHNVRLDWAEYLAANYRVVEEVAEETKAAEYGIGATVGTTARTITAAELQAACEAAARSEFESASKWERYERATLSALRVLGIEVAS